MSTRLHRRYGRAVQRGVKLPPVVCPICRRRVYPVADRINAVPCYPTHGHRKYIHGSGCRASGRSVEYIAGLPVEGVEALRQRKPWPPVQPDVAPIAGGSLEHPIDMLADKRGRYYVNGNYEVGATLIVSIGPTAPKPWRARVTRVEPDAKSYVTLVGHA